MLQSSLSQQISDENLPNPAKLQSIDTILMTGDNVVARKKYNRKEQKKVIANLSHLPLMPLALVKLYRHKFYSSWTAKPVPHLPKYYASINS